MTTPEEKEKNREEYERRKKRGWKKVLLGFLGFLVVIFLLFPLMGFLWGTIGVNFQTSEGERVAKVIKISNRGLIWRTWEAEAVLTQGDLVSTYVWEFSIDAQDPEKGIRLDELRQAFENGKLVKITYEQRAGSVPWRSKTPYFLKGIRYE